MGAILSKRAGAGLDPCGVLQEPIRLGATGSADVVFCIGQTTNTPDAQALVEKYRNINLDAVLESVKAQWNSVCGAVEVRTPDRALDILDAYEKATTEGDRRGAVMFGDEMIDEASRKMALKFLSRGERAGMSRSSE